MGDMNKRRTGKAGDEPSASLESERVAVGRELRLARESRGLSIDDVAAALCIRKRHLVALEQGQAKELPGGPYTVGFVRAYADHVALDGGNLSRRYRSESAAEQSPQRLHFPEPMPDERTPIGAILLIAVILAAGVYGGWFYLSSHNRTMADLVSQLPAELSALQRDTPAIAPVASTGSASATVPPTNADLVPGSGGTEFTGLETTSVADTTTDTMAPPPDDEDGSPDESPETPAASAANVGELAPASPAQTAGATPPVAPMHTAAPMHTVASVPEVAPVAGVAITTTPDAANAPETVLQPQGAAASAEAALAAAADGRIFGDSQSGARIVIRAVQDSWVQVRDPKGELLISRVLRPGDQYRVPEQAGLSLVTGNAGGLEVLVDGTVAPRLGRAGDVLRGIVLEPARLSSGTAVTR
jgi:cytoskeleton protein RodZ